MKTTIAIYLYGVFPALIIGLGVWAVRLRRHRQEDKRQFKERLRKVCENE